MLNDSDSYTQGYSDDVAGLITDKIHTEDHRNVVLCEHVGTESDSTVKYLTIIDDDRSSSSGLTQQ